MTITTAGHTTLRSNQLRGSLIGPIAQPASNKRGGLTKRDHLSTAP